MAKAYTVQAELWSEGGVAHQPLETDSAGLPPLYAEHFFEQAGVCGEVKIYKREGMAGARGAFAGVAWVYREVEDVASMMEEVGHPYIDYSDYAKSVAELLK